MTSQGRRVREEPHPSPSPAIRKKPCGGKSANPRSPKSISVQEKACVVVERVWPLELDRPEVKCSLLSLKQINGGF